MERVTENLDSVLLEELRNIQKEQNDLIIKLGEYEYQRHQIYERLRNIDDNIKQCKADLDSSVAWLDNKLKSIDEKYPDGVIDLDSGIVNYAKI